MEDKGEILYYSTGCIEYTAMRTITDNYRVYSGKS
jgi:hypothetical protein